jgi:hypothetical protein
MDDHKIAGWNWAGGNAGNRNAAASGLLQEKIRGVDAFCSGRKCIQESNGHAELGHLGTKLLAVRTVPCDDGIEPL